jgi:hypothetical protein
MNSKPPNWTDDVGNRHVAPNMRDLPLLLQLGITRMMARTALNTVVYQKRQQEQLWARATEAVNILMCVLLPCVPNDEIDQYPYNEKWHFVARWYVRQHIPFVVSA